MNREALKLSRRSLLRAGAAAAALAGLRPGALLAVDGEPIRRAIPSSGERLALMGIGTSRTFDVGDDAERIRALLPVLQTFFDRHGQLIDSSPMYGSAESVVGSLLAEVQGRDALFAATKVWTDGEQSGVTQMQQSMQRMGVAGMDLMQIHNLRDWRVHLRTLRDWKERGKIRYLGITTSHGRFHPELEAIMQSEPLDFVQFSYNIAVRTAEQRLLPLAAEHGIATPTNPPSELGRLLSKVKPKPRPSRAAEYHRASWGQLFRMAIGAPSPASGIIPATSKHKHVLDNMAAGYGRLPDEAGRKRMAAWFEEIA